MYTTDATTKGWYISLVSGGEKMLSDPTVFGGMVLFTSYIPYTGTNPCATAGTAYLYAVAMQKVFVPGATYNTGAGLLGSGARSVLLGSGVASAPTIAQSSPGTTSSLFVSVSGGEGIVGTTATTLAAVTKTKADFDSTSGLIKRLAGTGVSTQILHWRDGRIQ
jgi:Tfp pilus tip-associated adhesin PilY1